MAHRWPWNFSSSVIYSIVAKPLKAEANLDFQERARALAEAARLRQLARSLRKELVIEGVKLGTLRIQMTRKKLRQKLQTLRS